MGRADGDDSDFLAEDQVALYLTSRYVHPATSSVRDAVAAGGETVIPAVIDRLAAGHTAEALDLIDLLEVMDREGYYAVDQNSQLMEMLEGYATAYDGVPHLEQHYVDRLDAIRNPEGTE